MSDDVYSFPKMEEERRFRGYQLDEEGVPTFQFVESGRVVRERFEVARGEMRRVLTWEKGSAPKINHPEGVEAKVEQEEKKLTVIYRWK